MDDILLFLISGITAVLLKKIFIKLMNCLVEEKTL